MGEVTLSAAVRSSLLALQRTTTLVERTQDRLSTGLRVASAIDDPVAFFQAKSLSDRASDFTGKKDGIDQGISTVTAALDAVDAIESIVRQLKGLAQSLKAATGTQFTDLVTQFNELRAQISNLTTDATYQGTNLVNATGASLTVEFSEKTASLLTINSVDLTQSGLSVGTVSQYTASDTVIEVNYAAATNATFGETQTIAFTYRGPDETFGSAVTFTVLYGTATLKVTVGTGESFALTQGGTFTLGITSVAQTSITTAAGATTTALAITATAATITSVAQGVTIYISETDSTAINVGITQLDSALTTLRSNASTLGSNVALLQTRLDFTNEYVNTLESGSAKLTLADINEEGANLLALQTRQQLGISALSFAGQAEQSVLSLFR